MKKTDNNTRIASPLSHYERVNSREHMCKCKVEHRPHRTLVTVAEYDETIGRVVNRSKFVTIDRQKEMENYRPSDFSLENLQAIGADLSTTMLIGSPTASIDHITDQLTNLANNE